MRPSGVACPSFDHGRDDLTADGMIDSVYSSPYALIALQWFTRVNYAMSQPLADALGAA